MKKLRTFISVFLCCCSIALTAQEKYAVLIIGDYAAKTLPDSVTPWGAENYDHPSTPMMEFWNDTYLMWSMLQEKGYSPENIFVLFADGVDFYRNPDYNWVHANYRPTSELILVTDYPATIQNVHNVFNGLRFGINGFPQITEDDFLFVWTFDHGDNNPETGNSNLWLIDGEIWDYEFAALVNPIPANKKMFWMQQCHGGGFADDLEAENVVFISAVPAPFKAWKADNYTNEYEYIVENELLSDIPYIHGEFNFHMISAVRGYSPTGETHYNHELLNNADTNSDRIVSAFEAYLWERDHESERHYPLYSDLARIGESTSLEYPTVLHPNIELDLFYRGLIGISKEIHITSTLTIADNAKIDFLNNASIIVDKGASLIIGKNVKIKGGESNKIIVYGNIQIDENSVIEPLVSDLYFGGIEIQKESKNAQFTNTIFNHSIFVNQGENLSVHNCLFNNCDNIQSFNGSVAFSNSEFTNSYLTISNQSSNQVYSATIQNCQFNASNSQNAIEVQSYSNYTITGNTILGRINGVQLFHAGAGAANSQTIENNAISNCAEAALILYNTTGFVKNNRIENNYCGVKLLNGSNVSMVGNSEAADIFHTQLIKDNTSHQIFVSQNSFPWYMKFNAIIDDYNTVPLVKYERPGQPNIKVDVTDNFWGVDFNAANDLYIDNGKYTHLPMWQPLNPYYPTELELQYKAANDAFAAGNYAEAKAQYTDIIENNPETVYAEASMKELLRVEPSAKGNLDELKNYYNTNATIVANENLSVLGDFLANLCDVHMENWQTAIDWYEAKIQNPANEQERIFAEIDLGYTYFLMENSANKAAAAVTGRMVEHKYETVKAYNTNRDYLLSLLPGQAASENVKQELRAMETGALLQNYPNPFSQSTTIWYKTDRDAQVQLVVYDMTGKEVARMNEGNQTKGTHSVEFHNSNLSEGIYFYTLTLDGQRTDSKKMNVVR